jgi:hypothetical protein
VPIVEAHKEPDQGTDVRTNPIADRTSVSGSNRREQRPSDASAVAGTIDRAHASANPTSDSGTHQGAIRGSNAPSDERAFEGAEYGSVESTNERAFGEWWERSEQGNGHPSAKKSLRQAHRPTAGCGHPARTYPSAVACANL